MTEDFMQRVWRLLRYAGDETVRRYEAAVAADAVAALIALLLDEREEPPVRKLAATLLGEARDARAVAPLTQALHDADPVVRARSALALGEFAEAGPEVTAQLIETLGDEDYYVRECGAKALGKLRRAEALPALREMSERDEVSTNREVAREAVEAIEGGA